MTEVKFVVQIYCQALAMTSNYTYIHRYINIIHIRTAQRYIRRQPCTKPPQNVMSEQCKLNILILIPIPYMFEFIKLYSQMFD